MIAKGFTEPTARIKALKAEVVNAVPEVEPYRAVLITESYKETEGMPAVMRRAKANEKIFNNLPVVIRDNELIVGALSVKPRSTNLCPEFSFDWVEKEFKTMATRMCDPFVITEETADILHEVFKYWKGKTTSELATSYMSQDCLDCQAGGVFTVGNYYFGGIGHVCVDYGKVLKIGFKGVIAEVVEAMNKLDANDPECLQKRAFYEAVIISYNAAINFAKRYSKKAAEMAATCTDPVRKAELLQISKNCDRVPENGATNFYEACQSFIITQMILQVESSGHSESPGRFDQYMYPYLEKDLASGAITKDFAQELLDCVFVKLNDLNKVRDQISAQAFAGFQVFQNIGAGGQTEDGMDATNELSYMMMETVAHLRLSAPSFSIRVWQGTPHEFLYSACALARLGYGLMSYDTDVTLEDIAELTDVFYIGGTKVGALCGEAVVFTKNNTPAHFINLIKKHGALLAKGRLNGVQFDVLFTDDLYFKISRHAIDMSEKLKTIFKEKGYEFYIDSPTNQQFFIIDNKKLEELEKHVRYGFWEKYDDTHTVVRFATSWATTEESIEKLKELL